MSRFRFLVISITILWTMGAPRIVYGGETTNVIKSLTIHECIERALTANLDIEFERINPRIASWGIVREESVFEPSLTGLTKYDDNTPPPNGRQTRTWETTSSVGGKLPSGTLYSLAASEVATAEPGSSFDHAGGVGISLSQPLLRNFGLDANTAAIRVARKNRLIAGHAFVRQVMDTITQVQIAYYELVFAIEDHKSKLEDLERARTLLQENRERVQIGVMSPLDVTQAEAGVAEREENVIVAERVIKDDENTLKRLVLRDVSEWRGQSLVPAEYPNAQRTELDVARSTRSALEMRPEFLQAKEEVERRGIQVKFNRNQLWPEVSLEGSYGLNGSGGTFDRFSDNLASGDAPHWSVDVAVTIPLGNRNARANYRTARLQSDQALVDLKRTEQDIVVDVDNKVRLVQSNLKRVDASRAASRLAEESLKAEDAKMRAGTSTVFLVLEAQAQLLAARTADIRARADYNQSLVALTRSEGTTLLKNEILLERE